MTRHRGYQKRYQRIEPLAADPVARLPEHHQRFSHGIVTDSSLGPGTGLIHNVLAPKQPFRMLAAIAGNLRELSQDTALLGA